MARFRENVCIAIRNPSSGLFLICHRKGFPREIGWQFPQGGLHRGRDLESEMRRELREEIGTDAVSVVAIAPRKYTYTFPEGLKRKHGDFDGQTQQWVLADLSAPESVISFDRVPAEFDAFEWVSASTVLDRIVDFKKKVYTEAMKDLGLAD
jgi:putative (di)nucleoside polyphosphate hydrolase